MRRMVWFVRCAAVVTVLVGYSLPLHAQLIGDPRSIDEEPAAADEDGSSQESTLDTASIEDLIAAAKSAATPQVPEELQDVAFDRYVDLLLLGDAWDRLAPALMTDVALQLAEGERVLFRPHKAIKSAELFQLAVKMAVDRRDQATLDRLQKHFERSGDKTASESLAASRKLVGEARTTDPALLIPVDEISPDGYALYRGILGEIKAARYVGNREVLDALDGQINDFPVLTDQQKKYLQSIMGQSRAGMADGEAPELANHLDKLMDASRNDQGQQIAAGILQVIAGALGGGGGMPGGGGVSGGGVVWPNNSGGNVVWPGNSGGSGGGGGGGGGGSNIDVGGDDDPGLGGDDSGDIGGSAAGVGGFNLSGTRPRRPSTSGYRPSVNRPQIPSHFRSRW